MISHAQGQNALVDTQARGIENKILNSNLDQNTKREALTLDFLSMGLITNFLSLKEMFRISLHGKPTFGVSLSAFS